MTVEADRVLEGFLETLERVEEGVRPEELAQDLQIDAGAVGEIRARLEGQGFRFAEEEGRWRLASAPDRLLPHWVRARLRTDRLGALVYYRAEVASTQDIAFELIVEGKPHGTLVIAEHQTAGRGRSGREWLSAPHRCLLFSLVVELEPPGTFASVLTVATSTALARAIREVADLPVSIRFPNDILVRNRKVGGILIETRDYGVPPPRAVVGVGVNVNQSKRELPKKLRDHATSLRLERRGHEPISRVALLRRILTDLERWIDQVALERYRDLEEAWNRYTGLEGREVVFAAAAEEVRGRILQATLRDGLRVRVAGGAERTYRLEHVADLRWGGRP
ncbi:MAG: biotin--[acetyl-CoA-carboxylase] ligase [Planctomycetota bacterium]